jgi:hypothetical protein
MRLAAGTMMTGIRALGHIPSNRFSRMTLKDEIKIFIQLVKPNHLISNPIAIPVP